MDVGLVLPMGDEPGTGVPSSYADISRLALDVEAAGLDSVWLYDHLLMVEGDEPPTGTWEPWTLPAALAAITHTVRLGTLVSCTSFRHPGLLAKMADTVAEISGDRLILGLGAGWHEPEYQAFGLPFDHRVDRFGEALHITATMLREGRATFAGRYYSVQDCPLLPERSERRIPILIGSGGGERMLSLVARWADAWNCAWYGVPDEKFSAIRDKLHAACAAEGRDPSAVEVTVGIIIGDGERRVPRDRDAIAEALAEWQERGVAHVICSPDPPDAAGVELLCEGARQFRAA
jgi:alkanesulfonate monooxygenase SsuD/methylene tetrahydromethanopterin reductase-like flavin-dependent oxidoreductase (luciferase family)